MAAWMFWGALFVCAYTYAGYLLILLVLEAASGLRRNARYLADPEAERERSWEPAVFPKVSVLIAAHNEASCIREKIENTLALDYPAERLEIWVGSDGSTDETDAIVRVYQARGVRLSAAPRGGKVAVLNRLGALASGELWLLTDANTMLDRGAVKRMARHFADRDVGAVCGRLRLVPPGRQSPPAEGLYWRYENLLKLYESGRGAVMGANGGLYMLRKSDFRPLPADTVVDDFVLSMRALIDRKRVIYEPEAVASEETAADASGEFRRRARIAAGNFRALGELWPLLVRADFASFAFWSHKVLRWCVPLCLVAAFAANAALLRTSRLYALLFAGQLFFYALAFAGGRSGHGALARAARLARYFVEMNVALFVGFWRFLRGTQAPVWQRTARTPGKRAA